MKYVFYIAFLFYYTSVVAQVERGVSVRLVPCFKGEHVIFSDVYYRLTPADSVLFETFKCYISGVKFRKDGKTVFAEKNSFHLLNSDEGYFMTIFIPMSEQVRFDELVFNLGIDSITNVSGALGGDLDPSKGMYWTWQSGYINFKLEGKSNLCVTRKNEFQLHLGGYSGAENALQTIRLKVPQTRNITIALPLDKYVSAIDLAKQNSVMRPGRQAVELSRIASGLFEVVTK